MYDERHQYMLEGYSLLETLSENLKQEIKFKAHSKMLVNQRILTRNFDFKLLREISLVVK